MTAGQDVVIIVPAELWGLARAALTTQRMRLRDLPDLPGAPRRYMVARVDGDIELSDGEREVLLLVAAGNDSIQIAKHLNISVETVRTRLSRTFRKLGVHDRAHAVAVAYQLGLLGGAE